MKLFGQIVRTVVNTALVPVAMAKDVFTLGGAATGHGRTYTAEQIDRLKVEAGEDDEFERAVLEAWTKRRDHNDLS